MFHTYKNLSRRSSVSQYEISLDRIAVRFLDGSLYLYTSRSAGSVHLRNMKERALRGLGLNRYIIQYVKYKYEAKR